MVWLFSACSDGSSENSGGSVASVKSTAEAAAPEATTSTTITEGLDQIIDGEPPTTTVSTDPIEQEAANVRHWSYQLFNSCSDDPQTCATENFSEVNTETFADRFTKTFDDRKRLGATVEASELPHEFTIFWSRKAKTSDGLVGVLTCGRNLNKTYNADGSDLNTTSPTELNLWLVVPGEDGQWRIDDLVNVQEFQAGDDEENTCSKFDGSELSDEEISVYLP